MLEKNSSRRCFVSLVFATSLFFVFVLSPIQGFATTSLRTAPTPVYSNDNSITIKSNSLNGTAIAGFLVDLRVNGTNVQSGYTPVTFSNLATGVQYGVVAFWHGSYFFRHFSDGELNRYELVTLNGSSTVTLDAMYEYVPPAKAASLNILAEFPNGTIIGTSEVIGNYIYHAPGMWLDVIPPNQKVPFTGTFTGGSILPFVLFKGETYTVEMTLGYANVTFSHWQDNNRTNNIRSITLNGNATYVAIYDAPNSTIVPNASVNRTNDIGILTIAIVLVLPCDFRMLTRRFSVEN
jgi:hypothetical protein